MGRESNTGSGRFGGELSIACNLAGDEQARRREAVGGLLDQGCLAGALEDGYELAFPEGTDRAMRLSEFIVAERSCCPFLAFEPGGILLRIRGQEGTKQFVGEELISRG